MYYNFLRMELFRLLKRKSTFIILGVLLALTIFTNWFYCSVNIGMTVQTGDAIEEYDQAFEAGYDAGTQMVDPEEDYQMFGRGLGMYGNASVSELYNYNSSSGNVILLLAIWVALFIGDIYLSSSQKVYLNSNANKGAWIGAKYTVVALYTTAMNLLLWPMVLLSSALFCGDVKLSFDFNFFVYFLVINFLCIAFSVIIAALNDITRKRVPGLVIGIILSQGIVSLLFAVLDILARVIKLDLGEFQIASLSIANRLAVFNLSTPSKDFCWGVTVGAIYIAISLFFVVLTAKKKDVV